MLGEDFPRQLSTRVCVLQSAIAWAETCRDARKLNSHKLETAQSGDACSDLSAEQGQVRAHSLSTQNTPSNHLQAHPIVHLVGSSQQSVYATATNNACLWAWGNGRWHGSRIDLVLL